MDCSICPELDLIEWHAELRAQMQGRRYPLGGMFEITDRCNLGCVHCFINQPSNSKLARDSELTTSQVKLVLDKVADAGCLFLTLTGGEVLLRPDFSEIYLHARKRGILVTLFTNATLLTPLLADMLAETRPKLIEVTLYGATQGTYESVTRVPGSYNKCLRGIEMLIDRGLKVNLKSVLMSLNLNEVDEMHAFASKLGVDFRYDGLLWPRLAGTREPFDYQIPMQKLIALDNADPERQKEWTRIADQFSGDKSRAEYVYNCGAGLQSFHIDSSGRMSICTMARRPAYNLLEMSFNEAWENLGELRKLKRKLETPCQTCTIGGLCAQCPGWSQTVHGDNETPVEFVCNLAHFRANQIKGSII